MIKSNFDTTGEQERNVLTVEIQCVTPPTEEQLAKMQARNKVIHKVTGIDLNAKAEARAQKKANKKSK